MNQPPSPHDAAFYDRALRRVLYVGMALGVAGTIYTFVSRGWRIGVGFLVGSALSLFSFRGLRRVGEGIGAGGRPPMGGSAVFYGLRYFIVGGAVYVIVKILEISLMPVLAGLFVSAAAVIVEILYELAFSR